jgi:hypothetical protein
MIRDQILAMLDKHVGNPQSVAAITRSIAGADETVVGLECYRLRSEGLIGRKGAGEPGRPFLFYLKTPRSRSC